MPHLDGLGVLEKMREMNLPPSAENHHADRFWARKYHSKSCATWSLLLHSEAF